MNPSVISLGPKWLLILMAVALGAFAILAASPLREPALRAAGWALVANDPVTSADIIVVSLDSSGAGVLETADLVESGVSSELRFSWTPRVKKTMSSSAGGSLTRVRRRSKFAS